MPRREEPAYRLIRDVTQEECPWLDRDFEMNEVVYAYWGPTYGCIGEGSAVSLKRGETPFFELPIDCLDGGAQ